MKKILVIDDEAMIRSVVAHFLSQKYEVVTKSDGLEGMNWLQEKKDMPDLIVCDIQMPNIDGYDFLKNIKSSGYFKDIPVIMLSGIDSSAERVKCLKLGAIDFIIKPFNPEELDIKIDIALGRNFL